MKKLLKTLFVISGSFAFAFLSSCDKNKEFDLSEESTTQTSSSTIESSDSSSSDVVTLTGIEITTQPERVVYKSSEQFDSKGLVVSKVMSDGSKIALNSESYTIKEQSRLFNASGTYSVKVSLNEDATKEASFDITYLKPQSIKVVDGCRIDYLKDEHIYSDTFNLEVTYNDTLKEVVSAKDCISGNSSFSEPGKNTLEFEYDYYDGDKLLSYQTTLEINVYDKDELTAKSFEMINQPSTSDFVVGNISDIANSLTNTLYSVEYSEIANVKYEIRFNECTADYSSVSEVSQSGTYNIKINYKNKNISLPVSLYALSDFTISGYSIDVSSIAEKTFYVGEIIDDKSAFLLGLNINAIYSKEGFSSITIPYAKRDKLLLETDFSKAGASKIKISDPNDNNKYIEYAITVLDTPVIEDGVYLEEDDGFYTIDFEIKNGVILNKPSFNSIITHEFVFKDLKRKKDKDGNTYLEFNYVLSGGNNIISLRSDLDLSLLDNYKQTENDKLIVFQDTAYVAINGKLDVNTVFNNAFMNNIPDGFFNFYEVYNKDKDELITDDYTFTEDTEIDLKFKAMSGKDQPFLGTYSGEMFGDSFTFTIKDDVIEFVIEGGDNPSFVYSYELIEGKYKIVSEETHVIVVDTNNNKATITMGDESCELTRVID